MAKDALGHGSESRGAADALSQGHPKSSAPKIHVAFSSDYENALAGHAKKAGFGPQFDAAAKASFEHASAAGRSIGSEFMRHMDLAEAHAMNARKVGEAAKTYNDSLKKAYTLGTAKRTTPLDLRRASATVASAHKSVRGAARVAVASLRLKR